MCVVSCPTGPTELVRPDWDTWALFLSDHSFLGLVQATHRLCPGSECLVDSTLYHYESASGDRHGTFLNLRDAITFAEEP